jgi:hypothetical protein
MGKKAEISGRLATKNAVAADGPEELALPGGVLPGWAIGSMLSGRGPKNVVY